MFRVDDPNDTMLEIDMGFRQSRIPPEERCPKCDGKGSVRTGGPSTCSLYANCIDCSGTGLKSRYEEIKKNLELLEKE